VGAYVGPQFIREMRGAPVGSFRLRTSLVVAFGWSEPNALAPFWGVLTVNVMLVAEVVSCRASAGKSAVLKTCVAEVTLGVCHKDVFQNMARQR